MHVEFYPDQLRFAGVIREKPILSHLHITLHVMHACMIAYKYRPHQQTEQSEPFTTTSQSSSHGKAPTRLRCGGISDDFVMSLLSSLK